MSESREQALVVEWFRWQYPQYKNNLFAIPNGSMLGGNRFAQINKLKKEGLLPGVSDLFLAVPSSGWHGMFLEMKDTKKTYCSVSGTQREFIIHMNSSGYYATWAAGFDDAKEKIQEYLKT